jgi:hypothetical protein
METQPEIHKIKKVTAPLAIDEIKEYFVKKDISFLIDLKASQLKGNMLLTYISNLDLPSEIDLEGETTDQLHLLMKDYFLSKSIVTSTNLSYLAAQILLDSVGFDSDTLFENGPMNRLERKKFIDENADILVRWNTFMVSTMLFLIVSYQAIEEKMNLKASQPEINDHDYVGFNVVNLFSVPGFMECYFSIPPKYPVYYFKPQFEEYIFKGKNLFFYYQTENNLIAMALEMALLGEQGPEVLLNLLPKTT